MKRPIRLSKSLALPLDVVTESVGILAVKRAGKSHTAKLLVEQLHRAGQQTVIVDPKGDWWGVRSSADGKGPGLPIVIVGGEHGDVPLEVGGGEIVARMVAVERVSVLIDLSELRKHQVATFMTAFLETLYRLKAKEEYRTPVMLVVDEADAIAPQRPMKGEERMLGAAEDIVRRGGQRGIGITLVTQRAAVLNKNVLTQVGVLILLRTTGKQDIEAVNDWIKHHQQEERRADVMRTIAAMPRGTAWVWAPGWPDVDGIFQQVEILPIETFDSGATPKPGERRVAPKTVADVDLEAVRRQMAATIEKAKAEDPRELKKRIADLQAQLKAAAAKPAPAQKEKRVDVPVPFVTDKQLARMEQVVARAEKIKAKLEAFTEPFEAQLDDVINLCKEVHAGVVAAKQRLAIPVPVLVERRPMPTPPRAPARPPRASSGPGEDLPKGERVVLTAVAQYDAGVTREQLTVLTGYKRSSRDTYVQRLRERGHVDTAGERIVATEAGVAALGGDYEPLPTGDELLQHWLGRLPEGERRVLEVVVRAYPKPVDREAISEATDYKRSSRDTYLQRLGARKLITPEGRGAVRAAEELFS